MGRVPGGAGSRRLIDPPEDGKGLSGLETIPGDGGGRSKAQVGVRIAHI